MTAPGVRPVVTDGVASTLVGDDAAVVWARADRAARMIVEYATSDTFRNARRVVGPSALEGSDFTARVHLTDLPRGQRVFYRVSFQDLADIRQFSEPVAGQLGTAPAPGARDVSLVFSADTVGQGWGLDPAFGGMQTYASMLGVEPDLFVNLGDAIYADAPLAAEVPLDDGRVWKNLTAEAKSKVAETLDEYRGNYRYNLQDAHMRRFNAAVPQLTVWDDHEVRDNWYFERRLDDDKRYAVKSVALLAARGPPGLLRVHADAGRRRGSGAALPLGALRPARGVPARPPQLPRRRTARTARRRWAIRRRSWARRRWPGSSGRWSPAPRPGRSWPAACRSAWWCATSRRTSRPWPRATPAAPLGRELEIADLLRFIKDERIDNVVWITGDVHYAAAHHYDPARARFTEFAPFWEFVAGPLHAGTFGPNALDPTFGPEVRFLSIPAGMKPNRPPSRRPAVLRAPRRRRQDRGAAGQPARARRPRDLRDHAAAGPGVSARATACVNYAAYQLGWLAAIARRRRRAWRALAPRSPCALTAVHVWLAVDRRGEAGLGRGGAGDRAGRRVVADRVGHLPAARRARRPPACRRCGCWRCGRSSPRPSASAWRA